MQKVVRNVACVCLATSLCVSIFSGCGKKSDNEVVSNSTSSIQDVGKLPIVSNPITITYFAQFTPGIIKDLSENEVYKELEKRTNIKISFQHPSGDTNQALQLIIASNDLPDVIEGNGKVYPGGPDKAIADGAYIKLNDYIDKFAPNYKKLRESNPEINKQTITDGGNLWSFAGIQTVRENPWTGLKIRKDWLEELGLPMPTTVDELYTTLKAFKEKKQASTPLTWWQTWMDNFGFLIGAWDIGPDFYRVGETVKFGPLEPGYKDYIECLRKWYQEGLIDREFPTRNSDNVQSLISHNKVGVFISNKDTSLTDKISAMPYITLKKDEKRHYGQINTYNKGNEACITKKCKNIAEVVRWFDYHYTEEGSRLFNYGIEGLTHVLQDGKPKFTDRILKNDKGYSASDLSWVFKVHVGPYLRDPEAFPGITERYKSDGDIWNNSLEGDYVLPPITLNADEGSEFSTIMTEVRSFVSEKTLKYIIGLDSMDSYPQFINQLKSMNIDKATSLYQQALTRYNKR